MSGADSREGHSTDRRDFDGRTVIVTGAAQGLGLEISREFVRRGASVVMVDVNAATLDQSAGEFPAMRATADVSRTEDVERVVADAVDATGRVDVCVNNAGILRDRMLWKLSDDDWEAVLAVHLGGTFRFTRACVPHFRGRAYGRVINVTSYTGLHGNVGQSAYAAAKAGIIGFTKTAAKELAAFGVTVNAISPNADTRMVQSIPAEKRAELEALIPQRRFGSGREIAAGVLFLASEEAGYITGAVLPIDGGLSM